MAILVTINTMRFLRSDIVWILLLLLAALFFRWPQIDDSLWLDELHTDWTMQSGLEEVAPRARMGNNYPVYFYLTYSTSNLLGHSERVLRLPSLLAGLAAIVTVYLLVRRWTDSKAAAVCAAGLVVIDPHALFYSIEARPYALIQWLGLVQVGAFVAWMGLGRCAKADDEESLVQDSTSNNGAAILWLATSALLFYLHCTSLLLPLTQLPLALIFAPSRTGKRRSEKWRFVAFWICLIGLVAIGLPSLLEIYSRRDAWNAFIKLPAAERIFTIFPLVVCLCPAVLGLLDLVSTTRTPEQVANRRAVNGRLILVALMFLLPLLVAFMATRMDVARLFLRRYLMVVSCLPMLWVGLWLGRVSTARGRCLAALTTLAIAAALSGPFVEWQRSGRWVNRGREDWRSAVALVNAQANPNDVVYVASDLIESDRLHDPNEFADERFASYCKLPVVGLYRLREDLQVIPLPMHKCEEFVRSNSIAPADWIISRRNDEARIESLKPVGASAERMRDRRPTVIRW